jgi:hypothetical protein
MTSLADDIATYVGFGEHRAGTPGEVNTAGWLQQRLASLGYQIEQQKFPVRTILNPGGHLAAGDVTADIFPQWLPPVDMLGTTIDAPLVPLDAPAHGPSIRIMTQPTPARGNWGATQNACVTEAVAKGAAALVMAQDDGSAELYVSNQHDLDQLPIPVALIAARVLPPLAKIATAASPTTARLTLKGDATDTHAINVVGRKRGRGRTLVLSTPLTGWFTCGAERGPGMALLLRMATVFAQHERPVVVLGTGSHEIAHLGMAHVLKYGAPKPDDVCFWFHFGASIGARKLDAIYGRKSPQFLTSTTRSERPLREALFEHVPVYVEGSPGIPGESGQVMRARYQRFAGMVGTFPTFHTPADRGEAIDLDLLEKIADASHVLLQAAADAAD